MRQGCLIVFIKICHGVWWSTILWREFFYKIKILIYHQNVKEFLNYLDVFK